MTRLFIKTPRGVIRALGESIYNNDGTFEIIDAGFYWIIKKPKEDGSIFCVNVGKQASIQGQVDDGSFELQLCEWQFLNNNIKKHFDRLLEGTNHVND